MQNNNPDNTPKVPGTNPNTTSRDGGINPSAPTIGTEGYGNTSDERHIVGAPDPTASHPGIQGAGDVRRTSYPRNESADNPAANIGNVRKRSEQLSDNPDARGEKVFSCSESGIENCTWTVSGDSADKMMPDIERHGREAHGIQSFDETARRRILDAIHERRAA